jgi:hypothetical protein
LQSRARLLGRHVLSGGFRVRRPHARSVIRRVSTGCLPSLTVLAAAALGV